MNLNVDEKYAICKVMASFLKELEPVRLPGGRHNLNGWVLNTKDKVFCLNPRDIVLLELGLEKLQMELEIRSLVDDSKHPVNIKKIWEKVEKNGKPKLHEVEKFFKDVLIPEMKEDEILEVIYTESSDALL